MAEILAPAGGKESLIAAVRSGADAVYLGLNDLSARKNAENFSEEGLIDAVRFCHERGVKVYLAVNTIIRDSEFSIAENAARIAAAAGVDALIVADLGLIRYFKKVVPFIPIHASTQTSVFSEYGARVLEDLGVKRIVLGRELSEEEIIRIRNAVKCELEVFVHGAHCMSVSGQCLFSAFLGGRSGNRGLCAGTCRLPFYSSVTRENYSLSLKDLSLYDKIDRLLEIGVNSFKIEGRMKRPEYVSAATHSLRLVLDNRSYDKALLEGVFSRNGFTSGFFDGKLGKDMFGKREKEDVLAAPDAIKKIHEFYKRERNSNPVSGKFILKAKSAELWLSDSLGNEACEKTEAVSLALNKPSDENYVKEIISKLGATPFYLEKLDLEVEEGLFISKKELNTLKNSCVEKLLQLRRCVNNPKPNVYDFSSAPVFKGAVQKRYAFLGEYSENEAKKFDRVFVPIDKINDETPSDVVIALPRYFTPKTGEKLKEKLKNLQKKGFSFAAADNLNSLGLLLTLGFKIIGTSGLNVINSEAIRVLENLGAEEIVVSVEAGVKDINSLKSNVHLGFIGFGFVPLMLTRVCPVTKNRNCKKCSVRGGKLRDRMGEEFPVRCGGDYSEVLNNRPLWVLDRLGEFKGASFTLLDLREGSETLGKPFERHTRGLYDNKLL